MEKIITALRKLATEVDKDKTDEIIPEIEGTVCHLLDHMHRH